MIFRSIKNMLTSKDLRAQLITMEIMKHQGRLIFYHAAIETGLLKMLETPSTSDLIALKLKISNTQLLSSLLDLGCSLKELSFKNGEYRLKGPMAKALTRNVPITELVRETVQYHADVALRLDTYILKNKKGDYLKDFGGIIAESSRLMEPLIKAFIYHSVEKTSPLTILEIGCGSGEYLKYYVDINRENSGMAIEIDASAVTVARKHVKENNIEENFKIIHGSIMKPELLKNKKFDLVTSYSNIYYFSDEERKKLFSRIHKLLGENGRFMLATSIRSKSLGSCYYDLLFSATKGLYPLPIKGDLINDLKIAGFSRVKIINLGDNLFKGFVAYK